MQRCKESNFRQSHGGCGLAQRWAGTRKPICAVAGVTGHTVERTPALETTCYLRMKTLLFKSRFSVYRIRKAPPQNGWRGRPTRERGLKRTGLWYASFRKSARACPRGFCTGVHGQRNSCNHEGARGASRYRRRALFSAHRTSRAPTAAPASSSRRHPRHRDAGSR
jgi:hypothetical protein